MQDLKYQLNKAKKPVTDPATKVPECYHKFLDVFSKEDLDKVLSHSKYDHKIKLLNRDKNYRQAVFCGISKPHLNFIKQFLEENLKKALSKLAKSYVPYQSYWLGSEKVVLDSVQTIES